MRHANSGKKLGRDSAHRKALYSNLAGALIEHGRIKTTVTKAKAVKPIAEQMITLGRRGDLHARRQATAFLRSQRRRPQAVRRGRPAVQGSPGGYTRIIKLGPRPGDAAEMVYLELVDERVRAEGARRVDGDRELQRRLRRPSTAEAEPRSRGRARRGREAVEDEAAEDEPEAEARRPQRLSAERVEAGCRRSTRPPPRAEREPPKSLRLDEPGLDRVLRAGAERGADDGDDRARRARDGVERAHEARLEELPAEHRERDSSKRDDDDRGDDGGVVVRDEERQRVQDPAEERARRR